MRAHGRMIVALTAVIVVISACQQSETTPAPTPQAKVAAPAPAAQPPAKVAPAAAPAPAEAPPAAPTAEAPPAGPTATASGPVEFKLDAMDFGTALGADGKVTQPTTVFAPSDTVYLSLATAGIPARTIAFKVRWMSEDGKVIDEMEKTIGPEGPATIEFHVARPGGWAAGKYKVDVSADGTFIVTRGFVVD